MATESTFAGKCRWPGVVGVKAADYTLSHGTAPAPARLEIWPQFGTVAMSGDLLLHDGIHEPVILRDCRVDGTRTERDASGRIITLTILDRRWRWKELGGVKGVYNQVDPDGKPYRYQKKNPRQLCELLLAEMGVVDYTIILPDVGEAWPAVAWNRTPPAQALEALVAGLGCRVCFRPDTGGVLITPPGIGADLPPGHVSAESLALDLPERPDRLIGEGQPLRIQFRIKLEPLAEEWNGEYVPLNEVSYRPAAADVTAHRVKVTPAGGLGGIAPGDRFVIQIDGETEYAATYGSGVDPVAVVVAALAAEFDLTPEMPWRAIDHGTYLEIVGPDDGTPFDVVAWATGAPQTTLTWELLQQGIQVSDPWGQVPVQTMATVRATERLDHNEAIRKALNSVFRVYGVTILDPSGDPGTVTVPGYGGVIVRKEQIVLQQTRAEQIVPTFRERNDLGVTIPEWDEQGRMRETLFYDGHSRDKPAAVYGSYFVGTGKRTNTDPDTEVLIPFSINPQKQVIIFSRPVYTMVPGHTAAAELVLEVACNVRDATTNALVCLERSLEFPPPHFGTAPLYITRDDVQASIIGRYDGDHRLNGITLNDMDEAIDKLDYYLRAYAAQYEVTAGQERTYAGLHPARLDGAIQQITWSVGRGSTTRISRNSEHSRYVPKLPVRQKQVMQPAAGKRGATPPFEGIEGGKPPAPGGMLQMWEGSASQTGPR